MRDDNQIQLLDKFSKYYKDLPFGETKKNGLRYYYENEMYSYGDAIVLYSMIRI
jgi:hypothetical protein